MSDSPRRPWPLVALLFATATAGYLCRTNLSIAGALLMPEFGLTQAQLGRVFSAFLLGYAVFQMPGGWLADRWGARRVLMALPWLWVVFTVAVAFLGLGPLAALGASGFVALLVLRLLMGAAAGPTYPASSEGVSRWVPADARATANAWVFASVGFGSAMPLLISWVMTRWGWRASDRKSVV